MTHEQDPSSFAHCIQGAAALTLADQADSLGCGEFQDRA